MVVNSSIIEEKVCVWVCVCVCLCFLRRAALEKSRANKTGTRSPKSKLSIPKWLFFEISFCLKFYTVLKIFHNFFFFTEQQIEILSESNDIYIILNIGCRQRTEIYYSPKYSRLILKYRVFKKKLNEKEIFWNKSVLCTTYFKKNCILINCFFFVSITEWKASSKNLVTNFYTYIFVNFIFWKK